MYPDRRIYDIDSQCIDSVRIEDTLMPLNDAVEYLICLGFTKNEASYYIMSLDVESF